MGNNKKPLFKSMIQWLNVWLRSSSTQKTSSLRVDVLQGFSKKPVHSKRIKSLVDILSCCARMNTRKEKILSNHPGATTMNYFSVKIDSLDYTVAFDSREEMVEILPFLGVAFSANKVDQAWSGQETVNFIQNQKTNEWFVKAK